MPHKIQIFYSEECASLGEIHVSDEEYPAASAALRIIEAAAQLAFASTDGTEAASKVRATLYTFERAPTPRHLTLING
jgi:hypothetical protein